VSRHFDRIARPEQLLDALPAAMRALLDPAGAGAVTVALHQDVLGEAADFPAAFFAERTWLVTRRPPAVDELGAAASVLRGARRPLIVAGGGVRYAGAEDALAALAARTGTPVAETSAGKGVMAPGPLNLGGLGVNGTAAANAIAARADAVLLAGTRLTDFTTSSSTGFRNPDVRFVGLNVDAADAHKLGATPLTCDARLGLEALLDVVAPVDPAYREEVVAEGERWRRSYAAEVDAGADALTPAEVHARVSAAMRPGDWVVAAAGWAPGDVLKAWRLGPGTSAHVEFGFSCMGHEIPAGLGIRMHDGAEGEVIVLIGDGTYLMGASELVTSVQHDLRLTVVVMDNAGYGSIDHLARSGAGVSVGNDFVARDGAAVPVDYAGNAESFGCRGVRARDGAELATALAEARECGRTTVIHCPTVPRRPLPGSGAFWDLGVPEAGAPGAALAAQVEGRRLQRPAR
jgi:3D-(3,5/4)-trihydroxycyclohexane-1,2-dione acylhydrolase (decyclizing)